MRAKAIIAAWVLLTACLPVASEAMWTPPGGTPLVVGATPAATQDMKVGSAVEYLVPAGETEDFDLYIWAQSLTIEGTVNGDVIAGCQTACICGTVAEDLNLFCEKLRIEGEIGDDFRGVAETITIDGVVRGDVIAAGGSIYINEGATVEGNLLVAAGNTYVDGVVGGDARVATGIMRLNGTIEGDAWVKSDGGIFIGSAARVGGDLTYSAPRRADRDEDAAAGAVAYRPTERLEDQVGDRISRFSRTLKVLSHLFLFFGALVAGSVLFAFTRKHARRTADTLRRKPFKSLGIGFVAFICVPIVALICVVLVVPIPLAFVLMLAYAAAVYIAKFYVATWVGDVILRRGGPDASPIPSMLLGLVVLYVLTAIPYLGTIITFVIVFFGLGALLQRKETGLETAFEPPPAPEPPGLPSTFPGSTAEE